MIHKSFQQQCFFTILLLLSLFLGIGCRDGSTAAREQDSSKLEGGPVTQTDPPGSSGSSNLNHPQNKVSSDPSTPLRGQPSFNHAATQTELSYFEDKETESLNSRGSAVSELNSPAKPLADLPEEKVDHSPNFDHNETSQTEQVASQEVPSQNNSAMPNFRDNSPQEKDFSNRFFQIREKSLDSELIQSDQFLWEHKDLSHKKCKSFFRKGGLYEKTIQITIAHSSIDLQCFNEFPKKLQVLLLDHVTLRSSNRLTTMLTTEQLWMRAHESIFKSREDLSYVRLYVIDDPKNSKIVGNPKRFCAFTFFDSNGESFNFEEFKNKYGTNLTHLRLIANTMGPETAVKIAREFKNLSYLNLAYNQVGLTENAIEAIATLSSLTHLNLKGNLIDEFGAKALAKGQLKSLIYLDLENNNIGPNGAVSIASGNFHSLKSLNLERNQINDFGAFSIMKGNFKSLTHLNLACNSLSSKSMRFAVLKGDLNALTHLSILSGNHTDISTIEKRRVDHLINNVCKIDDEPIKVIQAFQLNLNSESKETSGNVIKCRPN